VPRSPSLGKKPGDQVSLQLPRGERKLKIKKLITLSEQIDDKSDAA
jgi:hypothetical protein